MAASGSGADGGGRGYSKRPSIFHQMDIDKGTELFRKQLEDNIGEKVGSQPSIMGGLPPHLLRQQSEKDPSPIVTDATNDRRRVSSGASTKSRQSHGVRMQEDRSRSLASVRPATNVHGHSQNMATPPKVVFPLNNPARQQQLRPCSTKTPPQIQPARETHVSASMVTVSVQAPSTSPDGPIQQQVRVDTRTPVNPDIGPATQGFSASRWADGPRQTLQTPQQVQYQSHQGKLEPRSEQNAVAPAGGIRLSAVASDDWSPFILSDGEQQQQQQQQTKNSELERVKLRRWRPKHTCDLQSQDLPDSVASSLTFSDSDCDSLRGNGAQGSLDIRNMVGGELDLVPKVHGKGFYNKNSWDEYPDESKALKWRPTYCQLWVKEMENQDWPVAVFLKIKDLSHEHCDVQTSNGWLMAPVDYPHTHINPEERIQGTQYDGRLSRRLINSAELKIKTDYQKIKRRVDEREGEVRWDPMEDPLPCVIPAEQPAEQHVGQRRGQPTPPPTQSHVIRSPVMASGQIVHRPEHIVHHRLYGTITHLPRTYESKPPPTYLRVSCFLRPAEANDIPQLLDIYNWEVSHGMQALDTNRLCLKDMKRVFDQCRDAKTPIIVAIAGTSAEAKARRDVSMAALGQYEACQQEPRPSAQQWKKDTVIGFAYVSILAPGLAGDVHRNVGRFRGQVHIYVTHECRRKGIGRALLQRTTIFCSRHAGHYAQEYEWHDPERTATYEDAFYNSRSYSRIFIEFASRGKVDVDTLWMSRFLHTENFFCVSTMDKARKVGYGENGELVDCLVWQHDCQDLDNMKENDSKRK